MNIFIITITAILMEPITTFLHRFVMHTCGIKLHRSHHDRIGKSFELNDLYPIIFSFIAIALFALGTKYIVIRDIAIGITIYGVLYFIVHEVIIHSRFLKIKSNNKLFTYWRFSHNVHHQYHGAPYGFIVPITPKELSERAKENPRDLITRY